MYRGYLLLCILLHITLTIFSQSWEDKFNDPHVNVFELETEFYQYINQLNHEEDLAELNQFARRLSHLKKRTDENGFLTEPMSLKELELLHQRNSDFMEQNRSFIEPWTFFGPNSSPAATSRNIYWQGIGRVTSIASHPNTPNRLLAGSETGGVWISEDLGSHWFKSNQGLLAHLGIAHIKYSEENPNIVYAATGGIRLYSLGVIKSTDGGYTWQLTNFTPAIASFLRIFELAVNPNNANDVIVSTNAGTHRSYDGGSSWTLVTSLIFQDLEFSRNNFGRIFGVTYLSDNPGFYYTPTDQNNWIQAKTFSSTSAYARIGVCEADPSIVYLWEEWYDDNYDIMSKFSKSINEGLSFNNITNIPSNILTTRGYIFRSMAVDQTDPDVIFLGAVGLAKSMDGGENWSRIDCNEKSCVHVDHWDARFINNSSNLYLATDGGIWTTSDSGATWDQRNEGLEITQYYRISCSETDPYVLMAGAQDNGTMIYKNGYTFIDGGDGTQNAIDPTDKNTIYFSSQYGGFSYSYDGGKSISQAINSSITGVSGQWTTPFVIDTKNPNILYAGYDRVWKSVDKGQTWTDFDHPSICASTYSCIKDLSVSKKNPNVIYAVAQNDVYRSENGGVNWSKRNSSSIILNRIETDPNNENRLWGTRVGSILQSNDGGINWTDIKGDLPFNIEFTDIVYDENTNDHLYVGTIAAGIYFKDASMANWIPYDLNMPKVEISDLEIVESYKLLRAATYGRGIWQTFTVDYQFCEDTLLVSNIINDGVYQSKDVLLSDGKELSGENVKFNALGSIQLLPNFEVETMALFEASIDSCISLVPPAYPPGYDCQSAFEIIGNNIIKAPAPVIGNGGTNYNRHAVWYTFNVPSNGELFIDSCDEKTRLKLWKGPCDSNDPDLNTLLAEASDNCGLASIGDGSLIENFSVNAGDEILLEWDNRHSSDPFQFSFTFIAE